jgi:hypothetical protein
VSDIKSQVSWALIGAKGSHQVKKEAAWRRVGMRDHEELGVVRHTTVVIAERARGPGRCLSGGRQGKRGKQVLVQVFYSGVCPRKQE